MNPEKLQIGNDAITYFEYKTDHPLKRIVLFCHGFPGGNRLDTMAKPLNPHGISVVEANYRGDEGCDGAFSFFGCMDDIEALTKKLRQEYSGIPITALGFSAGGYYASCLAKKQPDLFDKIVLLNPLLDVAFTQTPIMDDLWEEARQSLRLHEPEFYEEEIEKMLSEYNPVDFVNELTAKIHMVISTNDTVLSPKIAKKFHDQLSNPGEYVLIPNAQHGVRGDEPELIDVLM